MKTFFLAARFLILSAISQSETFSAFRADVATVYPVPETVHQSVFFQAEFLGKNEIKLIKESGKVQYFGNVLSESGLGSWLINERELLSRAPLNVFFNRAGTSNPAERAENTLTPLHRFITILINNHILETSALGGEQKKLQHEKRPAP